MTPDSSRSPEDEARNPRPTGRRFWERVATPVATAKNQTTSWLRSAFSGDDAAQHRVSPRTRSVQVGTAVVAVGVLGVLASPTGQEPHDTAHQAAAQETVQTAPVASSNSERGTAIPADNTSEQQPRIGHVAAANASTDRSDAVGPSIWPHVSDQVRDQGDSDSQRSSDSSSSDSQRGSDSSSSDSQAQTQPQGQSGPSDAAGSAEQPQDPIDTWITQAERVLERDGVPPEELDREGIRMMIEHESGGDPTIVNDWDSNATAGTPSMGLMQTIEPTFEEYAVEGHDDILHPVDNIAAGTKYAIDRYGSIAEVPGVDGVRSGGSYEGY